VPAFYVSFISRFGREQGTNTYYLAHVIVYAISLAIFTFVMVNTGLKQPALLYIIPSLILATFTTAGIRREWGSKLSIDSSLDGKDLIQVGIKANKEESARGITRFDPKQFSNSEEGGQEFKKFNDDKADEEEKS